MEHRTHRTNPGTVTSIGPTHDRCRKRTLASNLLEHQGITGPGPMCRDQVCHPAHGKPSLAVTTVNKSAPREEVQEIGRPNPVSRVASERATNTKH